MGLQTNLVYKLYQSGFLPKSPPNKIILFKVHSLWLDTFKLPSPASIAHRYSPKLKIDSCTITKKLGKLNVDDNKIF